ncbi:MAG: hypothetical protein EXS14_10230 [Planctomycetes bacterium]|nr:hypothetical protein [Planctomycetota bacterium]
MSRMLVALVAAALLAGACVKADTKTAVKTDASGTMSIELSYKLEAIESAKTRVEEMRARAEEAGREGPDQAQVDEQLSSFVKNFDPEKASADLKSRGFEVTKSEAFEKDGWKGVKLEGTFADINQVLAADRTKREATRAEAEAARTAAAAGGEQGGQGGRRQRGAGGMAGMMGRNRGTDTSAPFVAQFVSTDKPGIGKAVLLAPRENRNRAGQAGQGGQGGRGGRGGQGGQGGMGGGMEDIKRTLTISLPGKITETVNCKKVDDTTVSFDMKGMDMQPDEDGNMPNMVTQGVAVFFEIPEGCKINFEAPAAPKAAEKKEDTPAPNKKKGELRTDGGN